MNKIIIDTKKKNKNLKDIFFSRFYHIWLLGIITIVIKTLKKYRINYKELFLYIPIAILFSYAWQICLCHIPNDTVSAWMFYSHNILIKKPILGFVFEDLILFHPFGMIFGYLIFNKFNILSKNPIYEMEPLRYFFLFLFILITGFFAIFIDYSSRISFLFFIAPAIPLWYLYIHNINIKRFLLFFSIMICFVLIWDYICVAFPAKYFSLDNRCWFYIYENKHSIAYSPKSWMWLFNQCPLSIDIIYPAGGMFFMTGILSFIRDKIL